MNRNSKKYILLFVKSVVGTVAIGASLILGAEAKNPKGAIVIIICVIALFILQWISKKIASNKG